MINDYTVKPRARIFSELQADDLGTAAIGSLARWFRSCQPGSDDTQSACLDRLFALAHEIQVRSDCQSPHPPGHNVITLRIVK